MFCSECGAEIICNVDSYDCLTGSYEGYLELGVFEFKCKEFDMANEYFEKAIKKNPIADTPWFNKALILERRGETEEALKCFDHAIEINPNDAKC